MPRTGFTPSEAKDAFLQNDCMAVVFLFPSAIDNVYLAGYIYIYPYWYIKTAGIRKER